MNFEQIVNQLREVLSVPADGDVVEVATRVITESATLKTVTAERDTAQGKLAEAEKRIKDLEPQAADGVQYRKDLVDEALAEGVRAYGDKFDAETYRSMLEGAKLDVIKRMKSDWAAVGDGRFAPGRQSRDEGEPAPNGNQRKTNRLPDEAFAV